MSKKPKQSAQHTAVVTPSHSFESAPALEEAIDRLFPPDVLANLRDPDRPALERLDVSDAGELRSTLSC